MKKSVQIVIATLGLALVLGGVLAACKQSEGDRCQVDGDCEGDLICTGEGICRSIETNELDAQPVPDAAIDAAVDAVAP